MEFKYSLNNAAIIGSAKPTAVTGPNKDSSCVGSKYLLQHIKGMR